MKRITGNLLTVAVFLSSLFLFASKVNADMVRSPREPEIIIPVVFYIVVGGAIAVIILVSWLVIRAIARRKNVVNK